MFMKLFMYYLAVTELNGLLEKIASRCQFLKKSEKKFSIMTFYDYLKFLYSEKAKTIWKNLPLCFDDTKKFQKKAGDFLNL